MKPSVKGHRGKQKILALSKQTIDNPRYSNRYTNIDKLITNFETAYFNVTGIRIEIVYRKGWYYLGKIKWKHERFEMEFLNLLIKERDMPLTQIGNDDDK